MPKFDWNGNGKSDAFDHFMDMKVSDNSDSNGEENGAKASSLSYKRTSNTNENKELKGIAIGGN